MGDLVSEYVIELGAGVEILINNAHAEPLLALPLITVMDLGLPRRH